MYSIEENLLKPIIDYIAFQPTKHAYIMNAAVLNLIETGYWLVAAFCFVSVSDRDLRFVLHCCNLNVGAVFEMLNITNLQHRISSPSPPKKKQKRKTSTWQAWPSVFCSMLLYMLMHFKLDRHCLDEKIGHDLLICALHS